MTLNSICLLLFNNLSSFYFEDIEKRQWTRLYPTGKNPPAAEKGCCWEYKGEIYIFGGYNYDSQQSAENDLYQTDSDNQTGGEWYNFLFIYNPR